MNDKNWKKGPKIHVEETDKVSYRTVVIKMRVRKRKDKNRKLPYFYVKYM